MSDPIHDLAQQFRDACQQLDQSEHLVLQKLTHRLHVSRDTNRQFDDNLTFGQRVADKIASFGGSWPFIFLFFGALLFWVGLNSIILVRWGKPFDPYPYILLNLFLSMLASLQAPVIMMSQNRQSVKDRLDAAHDYEVNLKAELEIMALHEKIDSLRQTQWSELLELQQKQIEILSELQEKKATS